MKILCFIVLPLFFFSHGLCQTYDVLKDKLSERPHFGGVMGKYLNNPGLIFEPNVASVDGLIRFNKARPSTYKIYTNRLESILLKYQNEFQYSLENVYDCAAYQGYRPQSEWNTICRHDLTELGSMCSKQQGFGFEDGQPCIALSLERIENWLPEPYTNDTVPEKIRNDWYEYAVTVHCEGEDPVSKDNMGPILYFPAEGFHFKYFPYVGQNGWKSPIVFVRLDSATPATVVRVTCTAYAKNMKYDDLLNTGKVSFDVMVD
ncbi:sodium/potassium-transporting ATPase subunit beta-1-like [Mercenaria mercenaria]|uniref:sodium/potassium-transporting ATPase subunit beta-1-like n=1 Tax=Mercenaria mercenaria TaxID=6596 RepID=UPI00234F68F3|nr:sodium/potassium-transporting ATPase subunit beta-1-like [Mercenaria mercenaria]